MTIVNSTDWTRRGLGLGVVGLMIVVSFGLSRHGKRYEMRESG
jgi:hypothetical protein